MTEFRDWRLSGLDKESPHHITWIHGTLGIGKSIMAAYFVDLLKCQYPNTIVAYFFCRSKEAEVGSEGCNDTRGVMTLFLSQYDICIHADILFLYYFIIYQY